MVEGRFVMLFLIGYLAMVVFFPQEVIKQDSLKKPIPTERQYITWSDEYLSSTSDATLGSLNGYVWHRNQEGENPLGYAFGSKSIDGLIAWTLLDGGIHPRALNYNSFMGLKPTQGAPNRPHQLMVDLTFGNERGDPGVWSATNRITPNSDRKGPDMNLVYRFSPNTKNTFTVNGHFFETAVDDIPQIKRLKTVLDGEKTEGLRMPILSSYGFDGKYEYSSNSFKLSVYGASSISDNYDMNRTVGVELPQNLKQNLYAGFIDWKMGSKSPRISLKTSVQHVKINAIRNEINYISGQKWLISHYEGSIKQPLRKRLDFGVNASIEQFTLQPFSDDYSQLAAYLSLEGKQQKLALFYGFNGNSANLLQKENYKLVYSIANTSKTFVATIKAEQRALPHYKLDARLAIELQNNSQFISGINLSPWLVDVNIPSIKNKTDNTWSTNRKIDLTIDASTFGNFKLWYSNWDDFIGLFTNYRFNTSYAEVDRSLAVRNEIAVAQTLSNFSQVGASIRTNEYRLFEARNIGLSADAQWYREYNLPAISDTLQLQRMPFPTLQASVNLTTYITADFKIEFNIRYRNAVQLHYLKGLENAPHGNHKNLSEVDLGRFQIATNAVLFGNIHITKIVGVSKPIAVFVDLNNISRNGIVYHPFGAIDYMTLMTGIRLGIL